MSAPTAARGDAAPRDCQGMLSPRLEELSRLRLPAPGGAAGAARAAAGPRADRPVDRLAAAPAAAAPDRHPGRARPALEPLPADRRHAGPARGRGRLARPPLRAARGHDRSHPPRPRGRRHQGGAVPDRAGDHAGRQGGRKAGDPAAEPALQRLSRRRGHGGRRAGAADGIGRDRPSAGPRSPEPRAAGAHRRLLPVLAVQSAGRGRQISTTSAARSSWRAATIFC